MIRRTQKQIIDAFNEKLKMTHRGNLVVAYVKPGRGFFSVRDNSKKRWAAIKAKSCQQ